MRRIVLQQAAVMLCVTSAAQELRRTVDIKLATASSTPHPAMITSPSTRVYPTRANIIRRCYGTGSAPSGKEEHREEEEDFVLDAHAQLLRDARIHVQRSAIEELIDDLIPEDVAPTAEAKEVVRQRLQSNPLNRCIIADKVVITHVFDPDTGKEVKMKLPPQPIKEALKLAEERKLDLVQMAEKDSPREDEKGVRYAYCRIRNERAEIQRVLDAHVAAQGEADESGSDPKKMGESISHVFRDAVNTHFVGWRSRRIVQDMQKRHPVRLSIQRFVSPHSAVSKMHEMMDAIKKNAEENQVWHHFTGVNISEKELSVTLAPSLGLKGAAAKLVKHPSRKDWESVLVRFQNLCVESGRSGTYQKRNMLRKRNVGVRQFRVDKYGRKLD